jgi:predicted nucleic acid-binding protein
VILLDSNIFMYAGGRDHAHKVPSLTLVQRVARGDVNAGIDAEVLQEILHRYRAINRWADGRQVYDLTRRIVAQILPITVEIMDVARGLLDTYPQLMARDAVHAAVCLHHGFHTFCSYDRDLDVVTGIQRVEPQDIA